MNKNIKFYASIWAVLLVIFNVAVFVSPSEAAGMNKFGGAFWVGYIFITLAFIGQLAVSVFAFKEENLRKLFYRIPLVNISWSGLVLTLVFGVFCMVIPGLPNWVGIIACFAVLGFNVILLAKANMSAELVGDIDDKVKAQTLFVRSLTVDAEGLISRAKSDAVKAECKKVYEAVRYSDPMSSDALSGIESQIARKFSTLAAAVAEDNSEEATAAADEIVILIDDRNKKCKLLK